MASNTKRIDVVVRGGNSGYWHKHWNGTGWLPSQTGYTHLGGQFVFDPVTVLWGPDLVYVFGVGYDGSIQFRSLDKRTGSWSAAWTRLNSGDRRWASNPVVVALYPRTMELVAWGTDTALYHTTWRSGTWQPFVSLGGYFRSPPEVVSPGLDRFDIFILGLDGHVYHKWWIRGRGQGTGWLPLGREGNYEDLMGPFLDTPKAIARDEDRIDLVATSRGGILRHKFWNGDEWSSGWTAIDTPGVPVGKPQVVSWGPEKMELFFIGQDRGTYHKALKGAGQLDSSTPEVTLGGFATGDPIAAAGTGGDTIYVFHTGRELTLYGRMWTAQNGWRNWEHLGGTIWGGAVACSQGGAYSP